MLKSLLIQPIPYSGESSNSFLLRAAQLNKSSSVNNLFGREKLDFLAKQAPNCDLADQPRFKYALEILSLDRQYAHLAFEKAASTSRSARKWNNLEIDYSLLKYCSYSYCPKCLMEKPFFRKLWLFEPIYACSIHSVFLLDRCYQCNQTISLSSGEITTCSTCMASLTDAPTSSCSSMSNIKWFIEVLNKSSNDFFQEFTSYWLALDHFSKLDEARITTEQHLKMSREYFINPQKSAARLSRWINKRIHLAHPRIQLLPFLKHHYTFYDYIRLVEAKCKQYKPNLQSKNIQLTPGDIRLILDISNGTLRKWVKKDFLQQFVQEPNYYDSYSSKNIEMLLISKKDQCTYAPQLQPLDMQSIFATRLGVKNIAEKLNINYDTARKLVKITWVDLGKTSIEGKFLRGFSLSKFEEFDQKYILTSTLAKEIGVNRKRQFNTVLTPHHIATV